MELTHLHWSDAKAKLAHTGASAWTKSDAEVLEVVGAKRK
jgi:hypothetical protein